MGDAQRGDDAIAFYAAALGRTRKLVLATGVATQLSDADGPLAPGRYLLHVRFDATADEVWVAMGAFVKGSTLSVAADVPSFPFLEGGVVALEVNVLPNGSGAGGPAQRDRPNDQVAAICPTGTATLYITAISRGA